MAEETKIVITYGKDNPKDKKIKVRLLTKGPNGGVSSEDDTKIIEHGQKCSFMIHDRSRITVEEIE